MGTGWDTGLISAGLARGLATCLTGGASTCSSDGCEAGFLAIFGNQGDAGVDGIAGGSEFEGHAADADFAAIYRVDAEDGAAEFCAACAHEAGQADDLACMDAEADVL